MAGIALLLASQLLVPNRPVPGFRRYRFGRVEITCSHPSNRWLAILQPCSDFVTDFSFCLTIGNIHLVFCTPSLSLALALFGLITSPIA
jgi:hypothetical protein